MFEYLAEHADLAEVYQGAWAALTDELAAEAVQSFDFGRFRQVADLGGGHGRLLVALLRAHPQMTGILVDRPEVLGRVETPLAKEGFGARLRLVPGVLPHARPPAADAYVLKNTLHCFDDDTCRDMLRTVRDAMGEQASLLVIETVLPPGDAFDWGKLIDMEVMVNNGGRERTEPEWRDLLQGCGLRLDKITPATPPQWIMEAVRA